ncbi:MAG: 23S rRNA (adenine(2503)-C(2))-methyltransferase RlmN [Leptolyngbya sp. PLA1]|nr:23S rRNA (adenine(2503)-C(2))-methyltransferase RlmN [Leptolyngbya sp. PLA1]
MTAPTPSLNPLSHTSEEFVALARPLGVRTPAALAAYRACFRDGTLAAGVARASVPEIGTEVREESPEGTVIKFTQRVPGVGPSPGAESGNHAARPAFPDLRTESVLIPMISSRGERSYTLCVSSQIGCAMGCTFCETAQMGLIRSLSPAEIVGQWYAATHVLGIRPKNIVFMGMGEPLDNLPNVLQAIAVLKDHNGPHVPVSQITVSTSGRVDGIRALAEHVKQPGWHRLGLALSLNAPNDTDRSAIMPLNRKWPLASLQEALLAWPQRSGNKVCIEYVLIPGVNDSPAHATQIADFFRPFGLLAAGRIAGQPIMAVLNLIPYNPRRNSPWPAPTEDAVDAFLQRLIELGVFAKRRRTKGRSMMGACGQLGSEAIRKRRPVDLTISA